MTYRDNVEEMCSVLDRAERADAARWEAARLTYENTRENGAGEQPDRVTMEDWCAAVAERRGKSFSVHSGKRYRLVWMRFGIHNSEHLPDWTDAIVEVRGLSRERDVDLRARGATRRSSPEEKRNIFRELAADPAVVEDVAAFNSPTSRAVSELHERVDTIREERRERMVAADPLARTLEHHGAALDIEAACQHFARDCERFTREISATLPRAGQGREEHLVWVRDAIDRARSVLGQLEHYVLTGRTDLDTFLDEVLGGSRRG